MTPTDFRAWRHRLGLSQSGAARALGVSLRTVKNYDSGTKIPEPVKVAMRTVDLEREIERLRTALGGGYAYGD